uniref:Uncharacterized protein n=1 Tax=Opuntia streptacantha TaxID=393608 RepID=A0A7C9AWV3_OPUST
MIKIQYPPHPKKKTLLCIDCSSFRCNYYFSTQLGEEIHRLVVTSGYKTCSNKHKQQTAAKKRSEIKLYLHVHKSRTPNTQQHRANCCINSNETRSLHTFTPSPSV